MVGRYINGLDHVGPLISPLSSSVPGNDQAQSDGSHLGMHRSMQLAV